MLSQFGIEASPAVTYLIAFAIIFVLLTLFAVVLRRITGRRSMLAAQSGRTRQPRLGIVDVYDLDRQRQLILLRRDNVEHLLLVGGPNDVVVETNIVRVPGARLGASASEPERLETAPEPAPSRPVLEPPRPEPIPSFPEPTRPSEPVRPAEPARAGRNGQGLATARSPSATMPALPLQERAEPALKPDSVSLSHRDAPAPQAIETPPEPLPQPSPPVRVQVAPPPPLRPAEPLPPAQSPGPPAERALRARNEPAPAIGEGFASEPRGADSAVLSDMAKQLEQALSRSPPAGRAAEAPAAKAPALEPPPPRRLEPRPPRIGAEPPPPPPPPPSQPASAPEAPRPALRPTAAPRPESLRAAVTPALPPLPAAPASAGSASDPFSVEEIEAEFARLLGRPTRGDKG